MVDYGPIISAFIGAGLGSIGSAVVSDFLKRTNEKKIARQNLINLYLVQLQDTAESLWSRFSNIKDKGGKEVMENKYYEVSTLYALGCMLAFKRILLLDGIYSQIQQQIQTGYILLLKENIRRERRQKKPDDLGTFLDNELSIFDEELGRISYLDKFFHYDRMAVAEAVMERGADDHLRCCTYLDFMQRYNDPKSSVGMATQIAKNSIMNFKGDEVSGLMMILERIAKRLQTVTHVSTIFK